MMVFREQRIGKALVREEWFFVVLTHANGLQIRVESYRHMRKNAHKNKHWIGLCRWNDRYCSGDSLTECPPVPDELAADLRGRLASCPVVYAATEIR